MIVKPGQLWIDPRDGELIIVLKNEGNTLTTVWSSHLQNMIVTYYTDMLRRNYELVSKPR